MNGPLHRFQVIRTSGTYTHYFQADRCEYDADWVVFHGEGRIVALFPACEVESVIDSAAMLTKPPPELSPQMARKRAPKHLEEA